MNTLWLILHELLGLFVDDAGFALIILAIVVIACVLAWFDVGTATVGGVIAFGSLATLVESTLRAGKKR